MKYVLLLYHEAWPVHPDLEGIQLWEEYTADLQQAGVLVDAAALELSDAACTVRAGPDGAITTDGPFAETKEQLGGYYILDVATREEAAAWAAKVPSVPVGGSVEFRPVMEFD